MRGDVECLRKNSVFKQTGAAQILDHTDFMKLAVNYRCMFENEEPFQRTLDEKDFFIHALLINKPNFACAGTGFWCGLGKRLTLDERYNDLRLPFLYLAIVIGEGMSPGEEKFLNMVSKKHRFGSDGFPFWLIPVRYSIGSGTSESSGVLVTLFKRYQELCPGNRALRMTMARCDLGWEHMVRLINLDCCEFEEE